MNINIIYIYVSILGGNANMMSLWGGKGGSYMQALHFCFGIGGILSPVATEPFLAQSVCKSTLENSTKAGKLFTLNG